MRRPLTGSTIAAELRATGCDAFAVVADLTDEDQVTGAIDEVAGALGEPTILVNNAGMSSVRSPGKATQSGALGDIPPALWRASMSRNLDTAFLTTRAALPGMIAVGWG